jgi:Domain of unknown function (DUF5916)/Carbohydrate family 9 binding domain-like
LSIRLAWVSVALVCAIAPRPACAQAPLLQAPAASSASVDPNAFRVQAVYVPDGLTIDGKLDEAVYSTATPTTAFVQQEPHAGMPATEKTEVWVFFDDRNLYVSARLWDSHPERIVATEMRRDNGGVSQDESFSVVIDTFNDKRSGFLFITNPLGGMMDGSLTNEKEYNSNFNPIWTPKTARFEHGWTIEIAIPFKSVRYPSPGEQTWGINFRRVVRWKNEVVHLTPIPASYGLFGINRMSQTATLVGLRTPSVGKNLELKPYGIVGVTTDRLAVPPKSRDPNANAGFDVKYGLTRGLTADFTYNTDFAQVEDDQQQVNLTRFTLFFPEKREFFLEGQGIFNFGGGADTTELPVLFFSRRIGLANGLPIPIRVGGRLTGKVGKLSVGVLNIDTEESSLGTTPATGFRVVRMKRDIFGRGSVGVIATDRAPSGGQDSYAFGADANFGFGLTTINTYYAQTRTPGRSGQESSYYGQAEYNADRYGAVVELLTVDPNFNPDIGFLRRSDFRKEYASGRYSPRPKHLRGVRKLYYEASFKYITDSTNRLQSRAEVADLRGDLENGDAFAATYERDYEFIPSPFALQPGVIVPVGGYQFYNQSLSYTLGALHRFRGTLSASTGTFYDGIRRSAGYTAGRTDIAHRFSVEPSIALNWIDLPWGSFRTTLASGRSTYSFSPRSEVSAFIQYNSSANSLSTNLRFRWEYIPGSDLFVVYNDARTTLVPDRFADLQSRTFLVKMTRLFRY